MFGDGEYEGSPSPAAQAHLEGMTEIAYGDGTACGITADKKVKCWGKGSFGQLGRELPDGEREAGPEEVGGLSAATDAACGQNHCCALQEDGKVQCWGYDIGAKPTPVEGVTKAVQVAAESSMTCTVEESGVVACARGGRRLDPIAGANDVKLVSLDTNDACAVTNDGKVLCWCFNPKYSFMDCTKAETASPVELPGTALDVSVGQDHACALIEDGRVMCWGSNRRGQLGTGSLVDAKTPVVAPYTYAQPDEPIPMPSMLPEKDAEWADTLPEGCAEVAAPDDANFQVHASKAKVETDREGGVYYTLYLANVARDAETLTDRPRGEQRVVSATVKKEEVVQKTGNKEVRKIVTLAPGTYTTERGATESLRGGVMTRLGSTSLGGSLELKYVGEDYLCGTIDVTAGKDAEPVKARFAVPLDPEAAAAAAAGFDPGNTQPLEPTPEAQSVGKTTLVATPCSIEGFDYLGPSGMELAQAIAVTKDRVFLADPKGRIVSLTKKAGPGCSLVFDTSFGENGYLLLENEIRSLAVDGEDRVYASSGIFDSYRLADGGVALTCKEKSNHVEPAPSGKWALGHFPGSAPRKVTYTDNACTSEEWAFDSPFKMVHDIGFLDEKTVLVGGQLESEDKFPPHKVAVVPAEGGKPVMLLGGDKYPADDAMGWVHGIQPCPPGICVLDSNSRKMLVWTKKGDFVGKVDLSKLFGLKYPWIGDFQTRDGMGWFIAAQKREGEANVYQGLVYVVGPEGEVPAADATDDTDDGADDAEDSGAPPERADAHASVDEVESFCERWQTSIQKFGDQCNPLGRRLEREFSAHPMDFGALPDSPEYAAARKKCKKPAKATKKCKNNKYVKEAFKYVKGRP